MRLVSRPSAAFCASPNRRAVLTAMMGAGIAASLPVRGPAWANIPSTPVLAVESRIIEVKGRAARVFGIRGASGGFGLMQTEGSRLSGIVRNSTSDPLALHWHGQIHAPATQDRARPDGGELAGGAEDQHDFLLTPGTHWMHSHSLSEQSLLAAPMIVREKDAGDVQDVVIMLHDFSFRSPTELLAALGGTDAHAGHSGPMGHGGHGMAGGMSMAVHANDIAYDAFLANDRTLDDPEQVLVEKGGRVRLRIINGATATAFLIDTGRLKAECLAVDGSPCLPLGGNRFPLAQGQRIDLRIDIPRDGGAFPILADVEAARVRTGVILATPGAAVARLDSSRRTDAEQTGLAFEKSLRAARPLPEKKPDRSYRVILGEEAGYRWTLNGAVHGQHVPLQARRGERIEIAFMNPTAMMHPMHLHGHHFQVVGTHAGRYAGPVRDTVIVPPHELVVIAFDTDKPGAWFLHCHHLYHMAGGMMTELIVS